MIINFISKIAIIFLFSFFLLGCQVKQYTRSHGILFLENRLNNLIINTHNTNDAISLIGMPHSKSIDENEDSWIYIERVYGKGKYHQLGKNVILKNNVAVLTFDKYGILKKKKIYNKEDINKLGFNKNETENIMTQKSFVEKFLSSIKAKMYGNK